MFFKEQPILDRDPYRASWLINYWEEFQKDTKSISTFLRQIFWFSNPASAVPSDLHWGHQYSKTLTPANSRQVFNRSLI